MSTRNIDAADPTEQGITRLPEAILTRNPWPSSERIDEMHAQGILPGGPAYIAHSRHPDVAARREEDARSSRHTDWTVDDVTISAAALLNDDVLDAIAETLTCQTQAMSLIAACGSYAAHPPLAHLWRGIEAIEIHAFAGCHVMAAIRFDASTGGDLVYADGALAIGGTVPETVRLQALGTEMQGLLPHPIFLAHKWADEQRMPEVLNGPESSRRLGPKPGLQLARLARADRESLLEAAAQLGIEPDAAQAVSEQMPAGCDTPTEGGDEDRHGRGE